MLCVSNHFFFDGIDSRRYKVGLFREDWKISSSIGLTQSMEYEDSGNGSAPYFKNLTRSSTPLEFLVAKYDSLTETILPLDTRSRIEILGWLIQDSPKEFIDMQDEDIRLFVTFKDSTFESNRYLKGYIKITMEVYSSYAYLPANYNVNLTRGETKTIEIWNKSNCENYICPIIYINFTDESRLECFKIENLNTHESLKVYGKPGKYTIYNQNCFINGDYDNYEGEYIKLKKGVNNIRINGEGSYVFSVNNPITY